MTFATAYVLKDMDGLTNIEVGAGLREWVDVISSQHLFSGKDTRIKGWLQCSDFRHFGSDKKLTTFIEITHVFTNFLIKNTQFFSTKYYVIFVNFVQMLKTEKKRSLFGPIRNLFSFSTEKYW